MDWWIFVLFTPVGLLGLFLFIPLHVWWTRRASRKWVSQTTREIKLCTHYPIVEATDPLLGTPGCSQQIGELILNSGMTLEIHYFIPQGYPFLCPLWSFLQPGSNVPLNPTRKNSGAFKNVLIGRILALPPEQRPAIVQDLERTTHFLN